MNTRTSRETTTATAGNTLVKHPAGQPRRAWRCIWIDLVRGGQPRAYADTVDEFHVTFEGGTPSSKEGWDLPFATMHPPKAQPKGSKRYPPKTDQELPDEHFSVIKATVRMLIRRGWSADHTIGEQGSPGGPWLTEFEVLEAEDTHTTYKFVIVTPFMD